MTQPSPAGVPAGNGKYIAIVLVLLLGLGAIVVWKFVLDKPAPVVATANTAADSAKSAYEAKKQKRQEEDDLPPPVKLEDAAVEPEPTKSAPRQLGTGGPGPASTGGGECGKCTGAGGPDLSAAIRARAASAQNCYNRALASDSTLRGRVSVVVKVSSSGRVCGAGVTMNEVGGSVGACVANVMGSGAYPAPQGGCVDVNVPFNFVTNR